jgi:hypothetical protein
VLLPAEIPPIPEIPESERTPLVDALHAICLLQRQQIAEQQQQIAEQQEQIHLLKEEVQLLKDEIARLKGQKPKPKIKPSNLDRQGRRADGTDGTRPGSAKRSKLETLEIHERVPCPPVGGVPEGSTFKGHDTFTVQDIIIRPHNTQYLIERWLTPTGQELRGQLPAELNGGHCGPTLQSYVLYLHHHARVTQPLIKQMLEDFGVDISTGQIDRLLRERKARFHAEKDEILRVGLEVSRWINADDTGARHQGKNGYCTHIGNELFAWFASPASKSRLNFLGLLRGGHTDYVLSAEALAYMAEHKMPKEVLHVLQDHEATSYLDEASWRRFLVLCGINRSRHIRTATEGALLGSALGHGLNPELKVMSDDAGQFDVLLHALCWVHAERTVHKLVGFNDEQKAALEAKRQEIWALYAALKGYKAAPKAKYKKALEAKFDEIFQEKTCFATLNQALKRLHQNKAELLLVLEHPEIPLHNNGRENDIREYVTRRKVSGSTRSDLGRRCRDTFASLKKTCRKLGVSFWDYLKDRVSGSDTIPPLPEIVRQRAAEV